MDSGVPCDAAAEGSLVLNAPQREHFTPLTLAVVCGRLEAVRMLLGKRGVMVSSHAHARATLESPCIASVEYCELPCSSSAGAVTLRPCRVPCNRTGQVNWVDFRGRTPLAVACERVRRLRMAALP